MELALASHHFHITGLNFLGEHPIHQHFGGEFPQHRLGPRVYYIVSSVSIRQGVGALPIYLFDSGFVWEGTRASRVRR